MLPRACGHGSNGRAQGKMLLDRYVKRPPVQPEAASRDLPGFFFCGLLSPTLPSIFRRRTASLVPLGESTEDRLRSR
jgi:hypothetical protein